MNVIKDIIIDYLAEPAVTSTDMLAEADSSLTRIYGPTLERATLPRDHANGDSLSLVTRTSHCRSFWEMSSLDLVKASSHFRSQPRFFRVCPSSSNR